MGKQNDDIKDELAKFAAQYAPSTIVNATVMSVDESNATVVVTLVSGLEIDDVRIRSVIKAGNKAILIPKAGTNILIGQIEGEHDYVVIAVEDIEKILYEFGSVKMVVDDGGFLLMKGAENMQKLMLDILDANIAEKHLTNYGPTISLTPSSALKFTNLKTRVQNLFKNA
jgi:hypothetical protein